MTNGIRKRCVTLRRTARTAAISTAWALLALAAPAPAQELTVERIFTSAGLHPTSLPSTSWTPDGERLTYLQRRSDGQGTDLVAEDVETGERELLVDGSALIPPGHAGPIPIEGYQWSPDGGHLLIFTNTQFVWRRRTKGVYYLYELASGDLTPLSTEFGWQQFAKFSPDGTKVGFVRDNDLFVKHLATGEETRLTADGSESTINGTFDWVYEEELGLRDGWRWSPDGARIAYWQLDTTPVKSFPYDMEWMELYPKVVEVPYPKAGESNPVARIGVVEVEGGEVTWIDTGDNPDVYLARMEWAETPDQVVIQRMNRRQNRIDVLLADAESGHARTLFSETSETWVDVDDHFTWIRDGSRFLWSSERDGYRHLYLYDRTGEVVRQLTGGEWVISTPVGVDEDEGWVYFTGQRESPLETHLYRVSLDGGEVERVTESGGSHGVEMNPGATVFVDTHSRAGVPPTITLRRGSGEEIRTLVANDGLARRLDGMGLRPPEFFEFTTPDSVELNGWMIRPPDFDASREYPVLMYVYGGPGSQTVTDSWGGVRYLWHQLLAERGYIVASVDGRGTGGRGRAFKNVTYLDLGRWEARDQIAAAEHLASLPYVDGDRIGIWGSSYGGYTTLLSMMKGGDLFRAGISRAPVTSWKLYDTIYTERYMRTPRENPDGYRRSAPLNHVDGLTGDLLLLHGTGDDNVHFQNSVRMVEALQRAGKQFDFMIYPNRTHAIRGLESNLHLYRLMTDFLLENL